MKKKIGLCLVGAGRIGNIHAEEYRKFKKKIRFYVCDKAEKRAQIFARQFKADGWYTDFNEVLDNEEISAVDICLPHNIHAETAIAAARAGKHILLEKPIATSLKDADSIMEEVKTKKTILMIAENYRFEPTVEKTKELIGKRVIGNLNLIECVSMHHFIPSLWRRDMLISGGGVLIDRGIHMIDCLYNIGGEVESVQAAANHKVVDQIEGEDTMSATIRYKSGAIGRLLVSWGTINPPSIPWLVVFGDRGSIYEMPGMRCGTNKPPRLELNPTINVYSSSCPEYNVPNGKIIELQHDNPFEKEIEEYLRSIFTNRKPRMTGEIARKDLEIALAIYKSAENNETVKLPLAR